MDNSNTEADVHRDSLELKKLKDNTYKKNDGSSPPKNGNGKLNKESKKRYENESFDDDFRDNTE